MARRLFSGAFLSWGLALILAGAPPARGAPPDEGECPILSGAAGAPDAAPLLIKTGMRVDAEGLLALQSLLPREVWRHRERFFFEGMLMEIGPCHRRYSIPAFYRKATEKHAGEASLDEEGNLKNYRAGTPFPQQTIDAEDPMAGARWAWNLEKRFRGAGYAGRFRITDLPSRVGSVMRYRGDFFAFQAAGRSDLPNEQYRVPGSGTLLWSSGGEFSEPFGARGLAWRQLRGSRSESRWSRPDDIFVYIPSLRKVRRSATPWVDGAFLPRFSIAGQAQKSGGVALGGGGAPISPGAGASLAISEAARAGLTGLFLRPNAYVWRLRGERTVLAPLNAVNPGWPIVTERNYGHSGLSVAADRWDVRRAMIIEGRLREPGETVQSLTIYIDYQTLQPLYWIARTRSQRLVEVGILVHRFSGDLGDPPSWPDGSPAAIFEPVAASFANTLESSGGWLRESYQLRSLPFPPGKVKKMTTTDALERGH